MENYVIFWVKMANLGPIDFKIGLHIEVNVNNSESPYLRKFGQNCHQLAENRTLIGHNSVVFHPILTFFI